MLHQLSQFKKSLWSLLTLGLILASVSTVDARIEEIDAGADNPFSSLFGSPEGTDKADDKANGKEEQKDEKQEEAPNEGMKIPSLTEVIHEIRTVDWQAAWQSYVKNFNWVTFLLAVGKIVAIILSGIFVYRFLRRTEEKHLIKILTLIHVSETHLHDEHYLNSIKEISNCVLKWFCTFLVGMAVLAEQGMNVSPALNLSLEAARIILLVAVYVVATKFILRVVKKNVTKHLHRVLTLKHEESSATAATPLAKTIVPIAESIVHWLILFVAAIALLKDLGINTTPILSALGLLGIGIGMGSQALVKDIINGVLTLFDGNVAVGDYVKIGDSLGQIESMSLRAIVLRHTSGELQTIPFSEAVGVLNYSRKFNVIDPCITVTPDVDFEELIKAFHAVHADLKADPEYGPRILGDLTDIGIRSATIQGIVTVTNLMVTPDPEQEVTAQFRKRLLSECQKRNITLAYYQAPDESASA